MKGHQLFSALSEAHPAFTKAITEHSSNLGFFGRRKLKKSWEDYCGGSNEYPDFFKLYCIKDHGPKELEKRILKIKSLSNNIS